MRRLATFTLLVVLSLPAAAQVAPYLDAMPEMPLRQRHLWVAPERLFALDLPTAWGVVDFDKARGITTLKPLDEGVDASLVIRHFAVPAGALPRQLLLNALEQRLDKLPSFRESERRDVTVAGSPAAVISGGYYYQGNAQYPRVIEELYVVRGAEAFTFHFECYAPLAARVGSVLEGIYKSFAIRPPTSGTGGARSRPTQLPDGIDINRIPF